MHAPSVVPGGEPSWWLQEALAGERPGDAAPVHATDDDVDVAIVGGGFTGLWTALALRDRDAHLRMIVLEADICGTGASGRTGGITHGYMGYLAKAADALGDDGALAVARAGSRAQAGIREFCERRQEDVWWRPDGIVKISTVPAHDAKLARMVATAKRLGLAEYAVPLSPQELRARCASPTFRAGVWFPEGATVQPARLVRALRRAVLDAGVKIYEHSPMIDLRPGRPNVIRTPGGRVRADEVVLATNSALIGRAGIRPHVTNFSSYIVLTEPVPDLLEQIGWTGGEGISDGRMFLHYFRTTRDGRVAMGSGSGPIGFAGRTDARFTSDRAAAARAERGLRYLLPGLARARITHAWGGAIDVSADGLPFFKTHLGTRIHFGCGYSGHGVNPTWIGGQILASLALNRHDEWTTLPFCTRAVPTLPPEPMRYVGGRMIHAAILSCEDAEQAGNHPSALARGVAAVPALFHLRIGTR